MRNKEVGSFGGVLRPADIVAIGTINSTGVEIEARRPKFRRRPKRPLK